jgi:hypothetical protein
LETPGLIAVDGSQNAYIAGYTGGSQWYLAAYATTQSGNASFIYSTLPPFVPTAMAVDPTGNVYMGGSFSASGNGANGTQFIILNGAETSVPLGDEPGILVRFNSAGQNTYATLFGLASGSILGVSADPDGTAYVIGGAVNLTQVNGLPSGSGGTGGAFVAVVDTTQTGTASLLYSTYINAADIESQGYAISSNGSGEFAFSAIGTAISTYQWVNPLTQPVSLPQEQAGGYPFTGVIDTAKSGQDALIFLTMLDGVQRPAGVFLDNGPVGNFRSNTQGGPPAYTYNMYVAGYGCTICGNSPFLGVPGSYLTSLTPSGVDTPVFFYKIGLGPVDSLSASPFLLAFPSEELNTTSPPLSLTVTNTSSFAVPIETVLASSQFNETDNCADSSLGAGASCTINVTFEPTSISTSSAPTTGSISIGVLGSSVPLAENVTGIGVSATTPTGFFAPQNVAFGSQPNGSISSPFTVTLTNSGSVALNGEGYPIIYLSSFPGAFVLQSNTCGMTLAVGATCQATVAFAPTTTTASNNGNSNSYSQSLYAYFNGSGEATVTLTGTGVAPAPSGTLSTTMLTFPSTTVGASATPQNVTFTNTGNATLTGISFANPSGSGASSYTPLSGGCITLTSLTSGGQCTLTVPFAPQTTGTLTASVTISSNGVPATQTLSLTGTGLGTAQTITFYPLSDLPLGSSPFTVGATATSGLTVSFNSQTPTICSVSGVTVNLLAVGLCTVQATQGGNSTYAPAQPVNQSFQVTPAIQVINFAPLSNQPYGTPPFTVSASATSGLAVSFNSQTPAICTVSVATVTLVAVGTCTVQATQGGNGEWAPASPVNQSFQVTLESQTINFGPLGNQVFGSAPFAVSATATSGLTVSFNSSTPSVCTVVVATVNMIAGGTCTVVASQSGDAYYAPASPVSQSFQVTPASQTIVFGPLSNEPFGTPPFGLTANASSGLPVSFAPTTPTVCSVSGSTVSLTAVGTCTIQATQTGNASYSPATPVNQSFTVTQGSQTINFAALANQAYGTPPFTISATATSGLTVGFVSETASICSVSGDTVTLIAVGTCTIRARQPGNADWAAATPVNQSFTVTQGSQTIAFAPLPGQSFGTPAFTVSATASSGLTVTFASETTSICTLSGDAVTLVAVGTCTIRAKQPGNADWAAATPVNQSFTVSKGSQTIDFGTIPNKTLGDPPFTITATASSGLAVSFASETTTVCTVSGDTVTLVAVGTCTLRAKQPGNADWNAATPVNQSFHVAN